MFLRTVPWNFSIINVTAIPWKQIQEPWWQRYLPWNVNTKSISLVSKEWSYPHVLFQGVEWAETFQRGACCDGEDDAILHFIGLDLGLRRWACRFCSENDFTALLSQKQEGFTDFLLRASLHRGKLGGGKATSDMNLTSYHTLTELWPTWEDTCTHQNTSSGAQSGVVSMLRFQGRTLPWQKGMGGS